MRKATVEFENTKGKKVKFTVPAKVIKATIRQFAPHLLEGDACPMCVYVGNSCLPSAALDIRRCGVCPIGGYDRACLDLVPGLSAAREVRCEALVLKAATGKFCRWLLGTARTIGRRRYQLLSDFVEWIESVTVYHCGEV